MLNILGEHYKLLDDTNESLWRGDLILLPAEPGEDSRVYLVCIGAQNDALHLFNMVGPKAGARLNATIPRDASSPGALNLELTWLRKNWVSVFQFGSFEASQFYRWAGST